MSSPARLSRKWIFLLSTAIVACALVILMQLPFETCPSCRGTGAWNNDPRFGGQCGGGCGGSGRRSLWDRVFPPETKRSMPVPPAPDPH
jgi:hypothetical protein